MSSGIVFDIREFSVHDGPGIRTNVFLKGCPLHCAWCHNPEGQSFVPQEMTGRNSTRIVGQRWEACDLATRLNRQSELMRSVGGGVTFSGGEPLAQPEFLFEVINLLDKQHVVIETSGYAPCDVFEQALKLVHMFYFDLKLADSEKHRRFTGKGNERILENLNLLKQSGVPFVARVPLIPGVTDTPENLQSVTQLVKNCTNIVRVDLLPYNLSAGGKYVACGRKFNPEWNEGKSCNADVSLFLKSGIYARVV